MKSYKKIKMITMLLVFCCCFIFNISISIVNNSLVFSKERVTIFEGIDTSKWETDASDITNIKYISSLKANTYYYLLSDNNPLPMYSAPDKIYLGYYFNKLQSVQYFYTDDLMFDKIKEEITILLRQNGLNEKINSTENAITWCNNSTDAFVVLYRLIDNDKTTIVLSIANKKSVKEELNFNKNIGVPTSICYR